MLLAAAPRGCWASLNTDQAATLNSIVCRQPIATAPTQMVDKETLGIGPLAQLVLGLDGIEASALQGRDLGVANGMLHYALAVGVAHLGWVVHIRLISRPMRASTATKITPANMPMAVPSALLGNTPGTTSSNVGAFSSILVVTRACGAGWRKTARTAGAHP